MGGLKECLEAYGADYTATMERFMGNEALYRKIFDMFFQDENLRRLGAALKEEDDTAAFEAAHTLKGVTGNMGLLLFTMRSALWWSLCASENAGTNTRRFTGKLKGSLKQ